MSRTLVTAIPIVAAVSRVAPVRYAEIVAQVASQSAGPGTRANLDEFTETIAMAIEDAGGAERGRAIVILNPADPPTTMRDTVLCLVGDADPGAIEASVEAMAAEVARDVSGYRLKQAVQVTPVPGDLPLDTLIGAGPSRPRWQVSVWRKMSMALAGVRRIPSLPTARTA